MGVAGMTTPLREETYEKLLLNAGAFLVGFDPSECADAAALRTALATALADDTKNLGATRGGGSFTVTREMRQVEADGVRYRFVGDTFVDSVDANLSTTLIEHGVANYKTALGSADVTDATDKHTLELRTRIKKKDYLKNLCWVGDKSDGGFILIWLKNALNTADFAMTITDKGEVTYPVEFHAFQSKVTDYDKAPFTIIEFDTDEEEE